jgi:hypothetical protein
MTAAGRASCRGSMPIRRRIRWPLSSQTQRTACLWWTKSLRRCTRPLAKPLLADADELAKQVTDTPVDPHAYVGQYESVALAFRVIAYEEGIALRVRPKLLFYDGDTLEESPPLPLRPIRDGHVTTGQGFVTFLNPGADGRMQHLASRRRLHKRSG